VAGDLYDRLNQLKAARKAWAPAQNPHPEETKPAPEVQATGDWVEVAPLVKERRTRHAVPESLAAPFASVLHSAVIDPQHLRFMDTETTGLSGGAGTTIFLIGIGRIVFPGAAAEFELVQLLLTDFPGERAFLERGLAILGRETVWVSYNGKAFDARLLETRCIMNALPPAAPVHLDLLTWARRFWARLLPDCSLSTIERFALDRGREGDIPGADIPERYFAFLENQDTTTLSAVVDHHSRDIVSLAHLLAMLETLVNADHPPVPYDRVQVARKLFAADHAAAGRLLRQAIRDSDSDAERAAALLIHSLRGLKRADEAKRVAAQFAQPRSALLMEETAKLLEHDLRVPEEALQVVEEYVARADAADPLIAHRLERLRRKCAATASRLRAQ
jgi:uncharacterized protein YprB with RNaseH-like and TPR domain